MVMILVYAYAVWNLAVFLMYALDKLFAVRHKRRISEGTLIMSAFFMGGFGALMGMVVCNHKTSKKKFRVFVPLGYILNITLVIVGVIYMLR